MSRASDLTDIEFAENASTVAQENFALLMQRAYFLEPTDGAAAGPPASGTWSLDELYVDTARVVWRCTAAGTPGQWTRAFDPASAAIQMGGGSLTIQELAGLVLNGGGGAAGANPTAMVGLSAVNGSAGTFLRSDGAPALDQAISPTWSGYHSFSGGLGAAPVGGVINLTGDNTILTTTGRSLIRLSSDSGTATSRTFTLGAGSAQGQVLVLEWTGTNAGELLNNTGTAAARINGDWRPAQYDSLTLVYNGADWIELSRRSKVGFLGLSNNFYPLFNSTAPGSLINGNISELNNATSLGTSFDNALLALRGIVLGETVVNLLGDNTTISTSAARLKLSSDSGTASSRTFTLASGPSGASGKNNGWTILLQWTGANAGEMLSTASNVVLSADWRPADGDMLSLIWDTTTGKYHEQWRYPMAASATGSNPTAQVGLTAVNGSSGSFMRSDAAPPLAPELAAPGKLFNHWNLR